MKIQEKKRLFIFCVDHWEEIIYSARSSASGSSLARDSVLCSWARYLTLAVLLFTQVYKWVLVNVLQGVAL